MDFALYLRFLLALIAVLALIAGAAWAVRRFGLAGQLAPGAGRTPRLEVIEVKALDARRRLVLFRCDAQQHLLLLGPGGDLVVEAGIPSPGPASASGPAGAPGEERSAAG